MSGGHNASEQVLPHQYCPWEHFDSAWYSKRYMRRPAKGEPSDPFDHYTTFGSAMGHSPNPFFDEAWYCAQNSDVRTEVANGHFPSGFAHYCVVGHHDRDPHWLFSDTVYRNRRGDLSAEDLAGNGLRNGYHHFLIAGQNEGSSGSSFFDPKTLAGTTGDIENPFTTYLTTPRLGSVRLSAYFDPDWYLAMYEQVEYLVADGHYECALHHYLTNPTSWLFSGSADLDEAYYSEQYPDIAAAIQSGQLRTGYEQFIDHGRLENRQPSRWFDPLYYRQDKNVAQALRDDLSLTAFDHYLRHGRITGIPTIAPAHTIPKGRRTGQEPAGKDIFIRMAHLWASASLDSDGQAGICFSREDDPDISVVMCCFNHHDLTIQTLLHLSGSTGIRFEVILVDNASIDETRHIERRVEGMKILRNTRNRGFLSAINQGIALARGRFVLLLNNDVILPPTALHRAMRRLAGDPGIGAVGGKVVRSHGQLQEAGCVLFSDGSALGYGRDQDPFDPEYDFVRDVDYCSGVFLMLPRDLLISMGSLDIDYAPAYYEETDLCVRIWKRGLRVVYDPGVVIVHLEFGSSRNPDAPRALMRRNREILLNKHRDWLATKMVPDMRLAIAGRSAQRGKRVLFIEDVIPYRHIGSGFVRSADVVACLVALGYEVTVFPMNLTQHPPANRREGFHESVELLWNRTIDDVPAFFQERETYFNVVWICRAHNMHRLAAILGQDFRGPSWGPIGHAHVVLDTEALTCNRESALAALQGRSFDVGPALKREMRQAHLVQDIVCVNTREQAQLREAGFPRVHVLGHSIDLRPSPADFEARHDILALGSLYGIDTPNFDGLRWFIENVWPIVAHKLADARLLIAGFTADGLDVAKLLAGPRVEHLGFIADPSELYNTARVFLAPTRFAAGIPFKVHEAASYGVPVMATSLLAEQLDWRSGDGLVEEDVKHPDDFAFALTSLYSDPTLWNKTRAQALKRVSEECNRKKFMQSISTILRHV